MSDSSNVHASSAMGDALPTSGRLLGLDYGSKRIGIAVSTPEQNIASPLENYTRQGQESDARRLAAIAKEYAAVGIVVGLPVHMSGHESQKSGEAREFGRWVATVTGLPVCYWDERHTSLMAEAHLLSAELTKKKRKSRMDMVAAVFILQSYLDATDRERGPGAM